MKRTIKTRQTKVKVTIANKENASLTQQDFIIDKHLEGKKLEKAINKELLDNELLIKIDTFEMIEDESIYELSKEDFIKYATKIK